MKQEEKIDGEEMGESEKSNRKMKGNEVEGENEGNEKKIR